MSISFYIFHKVNRKPSRYHATATVVSAHCCYQAEESRSWESRWYPYFSYS